MELAEEFLEWYKCSIEDELDEEGDVLFWCAQIANILGATLDEQEPPGDRDTAEILKDILGKIKRVYRDDKKEYLVDVLGFVNELYANFRYYGEYEKAIAYNVKKLTRRKVDGTIQGEGNR